MKELFASGRAIDLVLTVIGIEVIFLQARYRQSGNGLSPLDLLGQLLSGALLLMALRCALTGADYRWSAAFLILSFPAHLFDLVRRSRRQANLATSSNRRRWQRHPAR